MVSSQNLFDTTSLQEHLPFRWNTAQRDEGAYQSKKGHSVCE